MKRLFLIQIFILFAYIIISAQDYDIKKQKLLDGYDAEVLNRSVTTADPINRETFGDIGAGDILHVLGNTSLFVVDPHWDRIIYTKEGFSGYKGLGEHGSGDGQFNTPTDICVLDNSVIWVNDMDNRRLVKLNYNVNTFQISFNTSYPIFDGYQPYKIVASETVDNFVFVIVNSKLAVFYEGSFHKFPDDFDFQSAGMNGIDLGMVNALDKRNEFLYINSRSQSKIYVLTLNESQFNGNMDLLFQQYHTYSYPTSDLVVDFVVHDGWPNHEIFIIGKNAQLKKIIPNETVELISLSIEANSTGTFPAFRDISIEPNHKEIIISQKWTNSTGVRKYAIAPNIQFIDHDYGYYVSTHDINFTLPNRAIVTAELYWPGGTSKIGTIKNNVSYESGSWIISFNENDVYGTLLPYRSNYVVKIIANSIYGDVNWNVTKSVTFAGGVYPNVYDLTVSSSYVLEGTNHTITGRSNRTEYSPSPNYPNYSQTWDIFATNPYMIGSVVKTSYSPIEFNYYSTYTASDFGLSKIMATYNMDNVKLKLDYQGLYDQLVLSIPVHGSEPGGCPILYIEDEPIVNLIPQAETLPGDHTDRVRVDPKYFVDKQSLDIQIIENDNDISSFSEIDLIIQDVPVDIKYQMAATGNPVFYKDRENAKNLYKTAIYNEGDTLAISLDGNTAFGVSGYINENNKADIFKDLSFSVYKSGIFKKDTTIFVDAAWTRIVPYETVFTPETDSTGTPLANTYIIKFLQTFILDSIITYADVNTKNEINYSLYKVEPRSQEEEAVSFSVSPDSVLNLSFDLPPLADGYRREGYLKVVGRYDPVNFTSIANSGAVPVKFHLYDNFPNPFNPSTKIAFALPATANVSVEIYNVLGQKVRVLNRGFSAPGFHKIEWNGRSSDGEQLSSGMYIYRLKLSYNDGTTVFTQAKKMLMLK